MTLQEVRKKIQPAKPCSLVQIRRYLKQLKIKPIGKLRQRPAKYPPYTADKILEALGESTAIPTMDQLKAERRKTAAVRRAA